MVKIGDTSFIDSVCNVQFFIKKLVVLCGRNFEKFNLLISHKKNNVQSRTNQNFYLLWIALNEMEIEAIKEKTDLAFEAISSIFETFQGIPDNLAVGKFIHDLENIEF